MLHICTAAFLKLSSKLAQLNSFDVKRKQMLLTAGNDTEKTFSSCPAIFVHGRNDKSTIFFDQ